MPFILKNTDELTPQRICEFIKMHRKAVCPKYEKLQRYYEGFHDILNRTPKYRDDDPCNNLVCNYAKYISDFAAGYLIGEPISYQSKEQNLDDLLKWNNIAQVDVQDMDNAKYQSIYGVAYELDYMSSDESPTPKTASIHPSNAFVIYNSTVELLPVAGVYYYDKRDPKTQNLVGYYVEVSRKADYIKFEIDVNFSLDVDSVTTEPNFFKDITLIEIYNNNEKQGDFEQIIPLIDGYNTQQSNRVDDVENFVNSLMVLTGQTLGYTNAEAEKNYNDIKKNGVIELTPESKLEFLTRQIDQQGNELLRQSLADDIHKFSCVPSMTDKDFASNVSGVAMQYKLLGLNQITKIKERYIKEGIRERIKLFSNIMATKGMKPVDLDDLTITITHSLPRNLVETAQVISTLQGICSNETLVAQLPFVEDPEEETKKAAEERRQEQDERYVMSTPPDIRNAE
ncbi:MAG: phage portal protein [Ruminococcus sp.]|nr:phage portal protein [Ruminococcus sp.]